MPRNISAANILLRRSFLLSSILCFCHIRKTTLKARNLYQNMYHIVKINIALSTTVIKQYVSFSNHSTIYFYCQSNSSKKSILLTDTSYATLFSVCVSDNFLTYSRLWILPQICTCPPTSKPEANLAFRPQQMHGM